jgi:TRAP-type C4-dicarboxylate transport system permease small subunit
MLVTATFTGMAWTTIRNEQISVQFVAERWGPTVNRWLDILIWAFATGYLVWFLYAAFTVAAANTWPIAEMVPDGIGSAPRWQYRWILAIAMVPFGMVSVLNLIRAVIRRDPYDDVIRPTNPEAHDAHATSGLITIDDGSMPASANADALAVELTEGTGLLDATTSGAEPPTHGDELTTDDDGTEDAR